jgi:mannose-6-phosphate isomerase
MSNIYRFKENRVRRAYFGGKRLDAFVGKDICEDSRYPEEWIASDVEAFNPDAPKENEGLSRCSDGTLFCDVLKNDPIKLLGERCATLDGGKISILVKLLDAAERLVIQCHPTVKFAKERFNSNFGKTECWYMLSAEEDACVYLGFKEGITREKWISLFETQNVQGMLDCLHRFNVKKGELWFVEGGVPHAIGGGCLMIELQEPSDLMVIPERVTPSGIALAEKKLHGGLGFGGMFDCFVYNGLSEEETKKRYRRAIAPEKNRMVDIVDNTLTEKFSMKLLSTDGESHIDLGDHYAIGIVTEGCGILHSDKDTDIKAGDNVFICANSGKITVEGKCSIVLCVSH